MDVKLPSNRKLGLFFSFLFSLLGAYFFISQALTASYFSFFLSISFLLIAALRAEALMPLNKLWMKIGLTLGMIVNPLVLGVIFFLLITPLGLALRLFGRDELCLKISEKSTFWKVRSKNHGAQHFFHRQF